MKTPKNEWFEVSTQGFKAIESAKKRSSVVFELLQNTFDEDGCTHVDVTITPPDKNGKSVLVVTDNAPAGYEDMSNTHTLFAPSYKKTDPTKRGQYNMGEKRAVVACDESSITSMTGQTIFNSDGTRSDGRKRTKVGSEFRGVWSLTQEEFDTLIREVNMTISPINATLNGTMLKKRKPLQTIDVSLPTKVADTRDGVMKDRKRKTQVRLFEVPANNEAWLYEKGIPVCPLDCKWSLEVMQKVPQDLQRGFVTDSYKVSLYVAVINKTHGLLDEDDMTASWVQRALEDDRISAEAAQSVVRKQFGEDAVVEDLQDKGSNTEAVAHGKKLIQRGTYNSKQWKNLRKKVKTLETASKSDGGKFATDVVAPDGDVPPAEWSTDLKRFVQLIKDVSPLLLDHPLSRVRVVDDEDSSLKGCTQWGRTKFVFTINLAYQNTHDWTENLDLLIHELAHFREQSNNHLVESFWSAESTFGAKLAQLALQKPKLFKGIDVKFEPEKARRKPVDAMAASSASSAE